MSNIIPEKVAMWNGYIGKKQLSGLIDAEMPSITFLTDTISGAGIAGELDSALIGQTEAMETVLNFRLPTKEALELMSPNGTKLTLRAGMQTIDKSTGTTLPQGFRVVMSIKPKGLELGSLTVGEGTETSVTFEVLAISVYVADASIVEIDKLNGVFRINGVDYLAPYKSLA